MRPPADVVDQEVTSDSVHPAAEATRRQIIPRLVVDPQQSFLGQIFGLVGVAGFEKQPGIDEPRRAAHEFLERRPIAALRLPHQSFVGFIHAVL